MNRTIDESVFRQLSAILPLALSLAALAIVVLHLALAPQSDSSDEGAAAHMFQLLLLAQVPIVAYFAITWLPRRPRAALLVLGLQAAAALAALTPVFIFKL